ncbi:MAG TPA: DUF190 domain-containing protein [Stellaceae bacterium]|nr:DUF190 domain-containing protein [Stellaceae bacterium]
MLGKSIGFDHWTRLHEGKLLPVCQGLPVVIEIVDNQDKAETFLPVLHGMMESGLVTLKAAKVLQQDRRRPRLRQQLKAQFGQRSHAA